jgi:hypothetical protein
MIDRPMRQQLIAVINDYLSERITAFKFDDQLQIAYKSEDRTAQWVASSLWFCYDDCTDHLVVGNRFEWEYFHRMLLLLHSDVEVEVIRQSYWTTRRVAVFGLLIGLAICAWFVGWSYWLALISILAGLCLYLVMKGREMNADPAPADRLYPFKSLPQLIAVHRQVEGFRKMPYPRKLLFRTIRSRGAQLGMRLLSMLWFVYWPLLLPLALFPDKKEVRLTLPPAVAE